MPSRGWRGSRTASRSSPARPAHTRRRRRTGWPEIATSILLLVVLVVVLEQLLPALGIRSYILPTPSVVGRALLNDLLAGTLWRHVLTTLLEILLGWILGSAVGFLLGVGLIQSPFLEAALTPYIVAMQAVPKVALAPVIVVAIGYGEASKIVIAALVSFFPILVNTMVGIRNADEQQLELMRALRASRLQTLRWVQLPGAMPTIFGGLEVAVVFSVVGAIIGEFTGASRGLGYLIEQRSFAMDQAGVFSTLVILSLMGLALDLLVRYAGRRMVYWQPIGHAVGI